MRRQNRFLHTILTLMGQFKDAFQLVAVSMRSRAALQAENLFLRKQLALFLERKTKPRRADDATRLVLALLSRLFVWKNSLVIVKPETFMGWHRKVFGLFWRWKSKARGRPRIPAELRRIIAGMAENNPTWARNGSRRSCCSNWGFPSRLGL